MADDSSDDDKTEEPTPRRLEKAREEGQVARSRELSTFMMLMAGVAGLWTTGPILYDQLGAVMEQAFLFDRSIAFDSTRMLAKLWTLGTNTLIALVPLMLLLTVVALVAPALLGGWLISAKSLEPQVSKLNPFKGLKRMFSSQALAELAKAIAKSVLTGSVAVAFLWARRGELLALMDQPLQQALFHALKLAATCCGLIVLSLIVVILIDVPYQLWSHNKKLRMTKDEVGS